jgi:hypothetical protein
MLMLGEVVRVIESAVDLKCRETGMWRIVGRVRMTWLLADGGRDEWTWDDTGWLSASSGKQDSGL